MEAKIREQLLKAYSPLPLSHRLFVRARLLLSDLEFVERYLPKSGLIIELGCGHGLFSILAALRHPERQVIGIDLSSTKIYLARQTAHPANVQFEIADAMTYTPPRPADAVAIVDVMYLLDPEAQRRVLAHAFTCLGPGGTLVWKAQETRPRWKYWCTYLQERIMTSTGVTLNPGKGLHFLPRHRATALLEACGFAAVSAIDMPSWRPYSDVLYLAHRPH